jgi:DNA-binding winged helix-turn-helix (wHTH) protein
MRACVTIREPASAGGDHDHPKRVRCRLPCQSDQVLTHRAILKAVWGANAVDQPEHLWVLMAQLRKKLEPDPAHPRYLISEPWVGYRFSTEPAPAAS